MKRVIRITMMLIACVIVSLLWPRQTLFAAVMVDTSQDYKIVNQNSGLVLGISDASLIAGAGALQWQDNGTPDHLWHFIPADNGFYKIENMNSGELLGISNASQSAGVGAVQWGDNGTSDHLWQFSDAGNGNYTIVNQNSGLVLGINGASQTAGAGVIQDVNNGSTSHLWKLVSSGSNAYVNPGNVSGSGVVHDPAMIKTANGLYYVFSTTNVAGRGIEMRSSTDRTNFIDAGNAFATIPAWTSAYNGGDGRLWAPDVSYHNGTYWLYYAASSFGSTNSAIGLATSSTAAPGSWSDQGIVYSTSAGMNYNAIDPCLIVDASGSWWLSFGSYKSGIQLVQLDPSTGKPFSQNPAPSLIAARTASDAIEGAFIYHHGNYYYQFTSIDQCCNGTSSTYHIVVGRSTSVSGPYVDRGGIVMTQGGGTILLSTHGNIFGPGGQMVMNDIDGDLLVYHYYDGNNIDNPGIPALGINLLGWDAQDWPYIH